MDKAYNFNHNLNLINGLLIVINVVFLFFIVSEAAPQSALISQLPGFSGTFPSKHYSGYISIFPFET